MSGMFKLAGQALVAMFRWFLCYIIVIIVTFIPIAVIAALLAAWGLYFSADGWIGPLLAFMFSFLVILATTMLSIRLASAPGSDTPVFGKPRWPTKVQP